MDHRHHILRSEWFGKIIFGPCQATLETINYSITSRKHDDDGIAKLRFGFQVASDFIAIHLRKAYIKYHQVRWRMSLFVECTYRLNAVRVAYGIEAFAFQAGFNDLTDSEGVVNDHNQFTHTKYPLSLIHTTIHINPLARSK